LTQDALDDLVIGPLQELAQNTGLISFDAPLLE